ncbi:MAG: hypothetical protein M1831_007541, partial [Alyxoria varia]
KAHLLSSNADLIVLPSKSVFHPRPSSPIQSIQPKQRPAPAGGNGPGNSGDGGGGEGGGGGGVGQLYIPEGTLKGKNVLLSDAAAGTRRAKPMSPA